MTEIFIIKWPVLRRCPQEPHHQCRSQEYGHSLTSRLHPMDSCENSDKASMFIHIVVFRSETKLSLFETHSIKTHYAGLCTSTTLLSSSTSSRKRLIYPVLIKGALKLLSIKFIKSLKSHQSCGRAPM